MSARKRKQSQDLQPVFNAIQDILISIKPKLTEASLKRSSPHSVLLEDLQKLTTLAESFTQNRPRANKECLPLADALDREGVHLWNVSGQLRDVEDDAMLQVFAASLCHVLLIASKAGANLSEIGRNDAAASVLTCAAKYEENLKSIGDAQGEQLEQAKARATVLYHSSRMEAACREGNDGVADFMLQKIIENERRLSLLQPRDRMALAAKLLEIGKTFLRNSRVNSAAVEPTRAQDSVKWLQKSFSIIELDNADIPGSVELKKPRCCNIHPIVYFTYSSEACAARAYFLTSTTDAGNLDRAEASLNELISSIDGSVDRDGSEHQQLRWMRVAILKRRKATEPQLLEAFGSIIDHMGFDSESSVTDILQELRTLSQHRVLVTAVHQHALKRALDTPDNAGLPHVDRLLLSLVVHCSRDGNHARAMQDIAAAFSCLSEAEFTLPKIPTTACLTLLWQFGDRQFNAKHWVEAADWFLAGTHPIFSSMAHAGGAKCFRKAALCYIQQRDYSKASAILRRCPVNEATTHYVVLLTAVHQGLENEAVRAVQAMVKASDFDRKMLLLATQLANESDMKSLLLSVLEELLRTLSTHDRPELEEETLTLFRCIIRLVMKLLDEPAANRAVLIPTLIRHFRTACDFVGSLRDKNRATMVSKDVSWLWRTAYNRAVQGLTEWENMEEVASELFDVSRTLLGIYCASVLTDVDAELYVHLVNASFAATAGRMFAARRKLTSGSALQDVPLATISDDIKDCKIRIQQVIDSNQFPSVEDADRARSFIHILRVFEAEVLSMRKEWKLLLLTIELRNQEATHSDELAIDTFEAIADLVWVEKECPVEVMFAALEAILHASLDRMSLSITKFSRWLRAICSILLSRSTPADRAKAIGYVEQAAAVMEEYVETQEGDDVYPIDERQWLLGTAYNTGIECLQSVHPLCAVGTPPHIVDPSIYSASMSDEAKRWFESATVICRFVPDGEARAEKISETYSHLLARYASGGSNSTKGP
ncbi:hypothetical protein BXZ70DRAFT_1007244 [Cristinia sonorae]|uniref:SPO22-domain-containing protein n=1 Tax=Cristinia sonorae TaxID=1940300 RepID=A0A8K0US30_9AGAR|nr:hypothetical protein BXZ70DRAFT_1007244 [Cristinia sonorae]